MMDLLIWKMKQSTSPKTWDNMLGKIVLSLESFRDLIIDGIRCIPNSIISLTIEIIVKRYLVTTFHLQTQLNLMLTTEDLKWLDPKSTSQLLTKTHGNSLILDIFTILILNLDLKLFTLHVQIVVTAKIYMLHLTRIPKL